MRARHVLLLVAVVVAVSACSSAWAAEGDFKVVPFPVRPWAYAVWTPGGAAVAPYPQVQWVLPGPVYWTPATPNTPWAIPWWPVMIFPANAEVPTFTTDYLFWYGYGGLGLPPVYGGVPNVWAQGIPMAPMPPVPPLPPPPPLGAVFPPGG